MRKKYLALFITGLFAGDIQAEWEFELSPYLYLLNAKADVNSDIYSGTLTRSFNQIYKVLDNAYFLKFIAKNDHWVSSFGMTHAKVSYHGDIDAISISAMAKYRTIYGTTGYQFIINPNLNIDLMAGLRYWEFKSSISADGANVNPSKYWSEPLLIAKATYQFIPDFFIEGNAELGTFSKNHSWQLGGNLNYNISDNWSAVIGYKWEYVKPNIEAADLKIKTNGAIIGASYRF
ncbi:MULTISPECIES: outer membrane protein [Providencia]|uniref:Outer membrane beta-barrel protein n=1 Tax=Providencia rettgeri TaxID=587 RepID=A0AAJ6FR58_PRORE|nr:MULTISPECIES: outer membrane beta-barrel protein [Providencia]ELR5166263.1 outer membrane beta-barrel protein [Providencia rettgeri]WHT81768.1 outer membrane beta-barrel protein [Providencia rettgeri]WHT95897.1 outer membrane beta-barrel protein [Providencia rettgeri]WJM88262.1 outer membrane beta-barrel protein [Providencia rettgeri]